MISCRLSPLVAVCAVVTTLLGPTTVLANEKSGGPTAQNLAVASDVRLAGDHSRTRLIFDLSREVEVTAFTLTDPYRVVVDLPQVTFQLPAKSGETGRGLVTAFRYGLVMPGGSRIVIDTSGPVRVDKSFVLDSVDGQPARLVLDLVSIDRESFLRELALEQKQRRKGEPQRKAEREPASTNDGRPVIVIDPGHGGVDSGTAAASGESEKTVVLDFARALRDRLEKVGKYRVVMTRNDDSFVSLADRVRVGRVNKAALFISIHADAIPRRDDETRGATIYTGSETASDGDAARLAESENRADLLAGAELAAEPDDVADILIDLTHRETKAFSAQFARTLVGQLKSAARMHKHPLRSAGFKVLKAPDVPSVLVELGYMSSAQDVKLITSETWRKRTTEAITQAVNQFFGTRLAGAGTAARPH